MNRLVLSFHASSLLVMAVATCSLAGEANNETPENAAVDYVVPQGNVSELKSYIERLVNYRPEKPADVVEYRSKVRPALQEAAERILRAAYNVNYADGSKALIPVVFGKDVRDWWIRDHGRPVTQGRVVWTGRNPASDKEHTELRFYLGVWENPHSEKTIASLDFVKIDSTNCAPICLAITAEE